MSQEMLVFPMSYAQEQLWFESQLKPESSAYTIANAVRVNGQLDVEAFQRSLQEIVRRHEVLRTTFDMLDGEPVQLIAEKADVSLNVIPLTHLSPEQREEDIQRRFAEEEEYVFNLKTGPLMRVNLLQFSETEYLLLLTIHHIITDKWSMGILIRELATLYEAFSQGLPSPLPELAVQYGDYAEWQREWLTEDRMKPHLSYWKEQLAGIPPLLELPTDKPRRPVQPYRGAKERIVLDAELTAGLKTLCREADATLFMGLLAVYALVLSRYSRQEDVVAGSVIATRKRRELESLIGFFLNNLVLRVTADNALSFQELLQQVRQTMLEAYQHQDMPFAHLIHALRPERNTSYNPLFQAVLVLENVPAEPLELPGLTLIPLETESMTADYDLALSIAEVKGELRGKFVYNAELFDAATIARMAGHVKTLLHRIIANPNASLSTFSLLPDKEWQQIVQEWNDTDAPYPHESCIHELFEAQVERTPDAVAVVYREQQLTYRELHEKANQTAHYVRKVGVQPEVLVGVCLERSLEMVIGILGVLKAGGAYLPLDPAYPQERLGFMLSDSQAPVVLTQQSLLAHLPETPAHCICLDRDWPQISLERNCTPNIKVSPEHLAYVIYTSGSTGTPKGTLILHKSVTNLVAVQAVLFNMTADSRILQFVSMSFDVSASDMFTTLCNGGTLYLISKPSLLSGTELLDLLKTFEITHIELPSSVLSVLPVQKLPALQVLIVGGEAISPEIAQQWSSGRKFINAYGPTETTVCATAYEYAGESSHIPIGRPIAHVQTYILDRFMNPVPVGISGELYIGGIGLARGYLGCPALTGENFLPDSFGNIPGGRLYKTGDLARYLPDGTIEFLGRIDYQVKLRGFRIELGEIEHTLHGHPDIQETAVLVHSNSEGEQRLVAYIVPVSGSTLDSQAIRQFLQQSLPDYMIPAAFVSLDRMPLTPNGKIDRKALPAPDQAHTLYTGQRVGARNPLEEKMVQTWQQVLGLEHVGIYDDFFDLGGDSLLAIKLAAQVRDAFEVDIPLRDLIDSPTIAGLSEMIVMRQSYHKAEEHVPSSAVQDSTSTNKTLDEFIRQHTTSLVQFDHRPLTDLFESGELPPVDAAAVGYLPLALLEIGLSRQTILQRWFDNQPLIVDTFASDLGRIASIVLPCFEDEIYQDQEYLTNLIVKALELSGGIGARAVSLVSFLPAATDYGQAVVKKIAGRNDLPLVSTGHATTTASVLLAIKKILAVSGRNMSEERVGCIGLGAIGETVLRLMLTFLPHPSEIRLYDVYQRTNDIQHLKERILQDFDFQGDIFIMKTQPDISPEMYESTFFIGATTIPNVLNVQALSPGSIIVDDFNPPDCFSTQLAVTRLQEQHDILFTKAGMLYSPFPKTFRVYLPQDLEQLDNAAQVLEESFFMPDPYHVMSCTFSSLLLAQFKQLRPMIGEVNSEIALQHYELLKHLGIHAPRLRCENSFLQDDLIQQFRQKFGQI